jgi:hypothetical protein
MAGNPPGPNSNGWTLEDREIRALDPNGIARLLRDRPGDLERLRFLLARVEAYLPDAVGRRGWFRTLNVDLDGASPLGLILAGRIDLVEDHVRHVETGQPD